MLHACLKWFKWSKFKNLKGCKKLDERWWVFSKWNEGWEKKCVGVWVFTIFCWRWSFSGLGIWIITAKRRGDFGTLSKLVGFFVRFFCIIIILFYLTIMLLHSLKKVQYNLFYFFCCLNFRHHITNFCNHYCCCKAFELWLFWKQTKEEICRKIVNHQDFIPLGM